jgi:hypothetical protein
MQRGSKTGQQIYELIVEYDVVTSASVSHLYCRSVSTLANSLIASVGNNCTNLASSEMGYAYLLCNNNISTYLLVYSASGSLLMNVSQSVVPLFYTCLTAYANYVAFTVDSSIYAYQISGSVLWTYTFASHTNSSVFVTDITIYNAWAVAITN